MKIGVICQTCVDSLTTSMQNQSQNKLRLWPKSLAFGGIECCNVLRYYKISINLLLQLQAINRGSLTNILILLNLCDGKTNI